MKNDDVELIQSVLSGDEDAFAELVNKHKKAVHALAWRVIGETSTLQKTLHRTPS